MVEATVPGRELVLIELGSPLVLGVIAVVIALALARRAGLRLPGKLGLTPGAGKAFRLATLIAIAIALLVPVIVAFGAVDPNYDYGVWLEDDTVTVRFYRHDTIKINVCEIESAVLLDTGEALEGLRYRVNGLSDPATGLVLGYFKTRDGRDAAVIVMGKHADKTLTILTRGGKVILVGIPGVDRVHAELAQRLEACGQAP